MTDVFVGYARADRKRVDVIVGHLRAEGWTVWYDDEIEAGETYRTTIRQQISAAKVAIVVWSRPSTESDWVVDEAVFAKSLGKLVPLRIDNAVLPFGFGGLHTHSLADWDGTARAASFQTLIRVIRKRLDDIAEPAAEPLPTVPATEHAPVPAEPVPKPMHYVLAVDLGTTYTAAALRDSSSGSAGIFGLGSRTAQIPSVLYRQADASFLVGESAERRGLVDPVHVVHEFKRRIGDTVPILVAGAPYSPQALTAVLLWWVVDEATERLGGAPEQVILTHPANWTTFKIDLLSEAAALADLPSVSVCTEPEAAARQYAQHHPIPVGDRICVFDLGGGTFDAAVLERTTTGFKLLGSPGGIEHLGGIDFDEAIFRKVLDDTDIDPADSTANRALARLRRDCVDAKEALSTDTDTVITARHAGTDIEIRVTRSEFEDLIRPALRSCITATNRVLRAAHTTPDQLTAFVLVGGSSRIPLIAETLISTYNRPVARTTHPKHDVALGAAATPPTPAVPARPMRPVDPALGAADAQPFHTVVTSEPVGSSPVDDSPGRHPGSPGEAHTNGTDRYPRIARQSDPPAAVSEAAEPDPISDPPKGITPQHGGPDGLREPGRTLDESSGVLRGAAAPVGKESPDKREVQRPGEGGRPAQPPRLSQPPMGGGSGNAVDAPSQGEPSKDPPKNRRPRRRMIVTVVAAVVVVVAVITVVLVARSVTQPPSDLAAPPGASHTSSAAASQGASEEVAISNSLATTLMQVPPATSAIVPVPAVAIPKTEGQPISVGATPGFVAITPDGRLAYIANRGAGVVTVVDTTVNEVIAEIPIPAGPPQYVAFTPDGNHAYVSIFNPEKTVNLVAVLDTRTSRVVQTISLDQKPVALAVSPDGQRVYVPSHDAHAIDIIDVATNALVQRVDVPPNPHWIRFTPDGKFAYIADHESNELSVLDTASNTVIQTIAVGTSPHSVAVSPDGKQVAVVCYDSNDVYFIDTTTNQVTGTVAVGTNPQDVTYSPDGRYVYTANVDSNTVSVVDTETRTVTANIPTGSPTSIAVLPNGRAAYVTNLDNGTLTVLDTGQ